MTGRRTSDETLEVGNESDKVYKITLIRTRAFLMR